MKRFALPIAAALLAAPALAADIQPGPCPAEYICFTATTDQPISAVSWLTDDMDFVREKNPDMLTFVGADGNLYIKAGETLIVSYDDQG